MVTFVAATKVAAPKVGATYRFIGVPAGTHPNLSLKIGRRVWSGGPVDKSRLAINNVFSTLQDALKARREIAKVLGLIVKKA